MILFKVNLKCITGFPFKGNAPWTIDMNTIAFWLSLKAMKIKAWNL